jgi:hypothetical protein
MLLSGLIAFLVTCLYASFLEWFVHRYGMHTELISKWSFRRHAIEHHSQRRSLKAFYAPVDPPTRYQVGEDSAVPLLWLAHIPLYLVLGWWNLGAGIGTALGAGFYLTAYEVLHFFIHTPRESWVQKTRLFRFYCEYHRIHHHRARWNYNVVFPLADFVLRTFSLEELPAEPSAPADVPPYTGPLSVLGRHAALMRRWARGGAGSHSLADASDG